MSRKVVAYQQDEKRLGPVRLQPKLNPLGQVVRLTIIKLTHDRGLGITIRYRLIAVKGKRRRDS